MIKQNCISKSFSVPKLLWQKVVSTAYARGISVSTLICIALIKELSYNGET